MKKFVLLIIVFITISVSLSAQSGSWRIVRHPFENERAKTEISAICNEGYLPIGMEVDYGKAIYIFYADDESIPFTGWVLYNFTNFDKLDVNFTKFITEGWVPMDISKTPGGLYTLFIKTDAFKIDGWRISAGGVTSDAISKTVDTFTAEGFSPWGLSMAEGKVWHLFLNDGKGQERPIYLNVFSNAPDEVKTKVNKDLSDGWLPWGMMMAADKIFIEYTKH